MEIMESFFLKVDELMSKKKLFQVWSSSALQLLSPSTSSEHTKRAVHTKPSSPTETV